MKPPALPAIPMPNGWNGSIKTALLGAFTLAHFTLVSLRAWAHHVRVPWVRRELRIERLESEVALLREQLRIVHSRYDKIPPAKRPHFCPAARFDILALQRARGWSNNRTAREFRIAQPTVAAWHELHADGSLLVVTEPVNKYPQDVTLLVQRLHRLFPFLGECSIASYLALGGLHVAATSVRRMLERPTPKPKPVPAQPAAKPTLRTVTARYPGHVWNIDLTTVPTSQGLALNWLPFSFPPVFPFCWKVVVVLDHFSRKVLAIRAFHKEPSADDIVRMLEAAVVAEGRPPKYTVTDKGAQFFNHHLGVPADHFQRWLDHHAVKPRFGAVGKKGSIAVIERFFKTLKYDGIRRLLVPYSQQLMQAELDCFARWYNSFRPHSALGVESRLPVVRTTRMRPI